MSLEDFKKAKEIFHCSNTKKLYLRESETKEIKKFLESKNNTLHISGNPGTGKTSTILKCLKHSDYLFTNHFNTPQIYEKIKLSNSNVIIIDEFDKFFESNKRKALNLIKTLKNKKLITISNTLDPLLFSTTSTSSDILHFKPYTCDEITFIIQKKITDELGNIINQIVDKDVIEIVSKKFSNKGDIRRVFEQLIFLFDSKIKNNDSFKLGIKDLVSEKENENNNFNLHHEIIREILSHQKELNEKKVYQKYLEKCSEMNIVAFDRGDFSVVYEMI